MKIFILTLGFIVICRFIEGQSSHPIKVFFLYGSKPASGYKDTEKRLFGGIHGGHVSIGIDSFVVSFRHLKGLHILPKRKNFDGQYEFMPMKTFEKDTVASKYTVFEFEITNDEYVTLKKVMEGYRTKTPYDYAFFGMRCAAASYDMLSHIGLFEPKSKRRMIFSNFYPRLFRKKMFALASIKNHKIIMQPGKISRKWEKD